MIKTIHGAVPMDADVLMIGVNPAHFDTFQRSIKGGFQSRHMGWSYVANLGKSLADVACDFIPKRPDLDVIFITNDIGLTKQKLEAGVRTMIAAMNCMSYDIKPYVALTESTAFLQPIFEAFSIVAEVTSIENLAGDRHTEKRRLAQLEAA